MQCISCRVWIEYLKVNAYNIYVFILYIRCFDINKQILIFTTIVTIATRYRLKGSMIEYRWGWNFPWRPECALMTPQLPVIWVHVSFPTVKWLERGTDHPLPSSAWLSKGWSCTYASCFNRVIGNKVTLICTYFY